MVRIRDLRNASKKFNNFFNNNNEVCVQYCGRIYFYFLERIYFLVPCLISPRVPVFSLSKLEIQLTETYFSEPTFKTS